MRVLPHIDPALRTRRGATLWVVEERAQVRVERGTCGVGPEIKEALAATPALRKAVYDKEVPIYVVVEKTVPRRNRRIMCANRPLYVGTSFVVMYIFRYKSADVNILGRTHLLGRKSRHISVRKDKE